MAAPPAPLPPEIAQQSSPEGAQAAMAAQGLPQQQPGMEQVQQIMGTAREIATKVDDLKTQLQQIHPPLVATLAPIDTALKQLLQGINKVAQRSGMAQGSPVMQSAPQGGGNPGAPPPNPMGV